MDSLLLLNGSPRGEKANSALLAARLGAGWESEGGAVRTLALARKSQRAEALEAFGQSETIVLLTPLYTDAMPSLVKEFIEELEPLTGQMAGVRLGFVVHSGFNEALHSRHLERYFEKLARRLGAEYAGTIIKGASEGLRMMPEKWNRKLWDRMVALGASLARDGRFEPELLAQVAGYERLGPGRRAFYQVFGRTPMARGYWNGALKKNGAYDDRFAAPYGEPA